MNTKDRGVIRVANATLRKDEWKQIDEAITKAARQRLVGIQDLRNAGLTYQIGNGLGTTVLEYEKVSDMNEAEINMDAITKADKDRADFSIGYLPLPITSKDFSINIRALEASRKRGQTLDVTQGELAARKVAEKNEETLFTGAGTYAYGGGTLYGYKDYPNANSVTLDAHWNDSGASGTTMLADTLSMKQALIDDRMFGPYGMYIPTNFETAIEDDFKSTSDKSIRQRLLEVEGLQFIKTADFLTDDYIIFLQLTSDVVRLVEGMDIRTVEWSSEGGMIFHYKVMSILVPQIRDDYSNRCGVVVATK